MTTHPPDLVYRLATGAIGVEEALDELVDALAARTGISTDEQAEIARLLRGAAACDPQLLTLKAALRTAAQEEHEGE
jgi:hypothetical protein